MPQKKQTKNEPSFEEAMAKLAGTVEEMESGKLTLDEMMRRFESGMEAVRFCTSKLNEVERRIEQLVKEDEQLNTIPFDTPQD